jgi:hypothetical protein
VGSQTYLSASDLNAAIASASVGTVIDFGPGVISRDSLPGVSAHYRQIAWGASGEPPRDANVVMQPAISMSKVSTLSLKSSLTLEVWRPDAQFFDKMLRILKALRDELHSLGLWSVLAAAATGTLRILEGNGVIGLQAKAALADMCARAQQPFSGFHRHSPLLFVLSESHPGPDLLYATYEVLTAVESLSFEILRRISTNEPQRALFQHGAKSYYGVLNCFSGLAFTPRFDYTKYRPEVHSACLGLKYVTKQFPTFNAWLFQLCMLYAFFNMAFSNSECCNAADLVDAVNNLLGTPQLTRATLSQLFRRDASNRIQLPRLSDEEEYFRMLSEFLPAISNDGNVALVGAVSTYGNQKSSRPGASAATHDRQEPVSDVCPKCGRGHSDCVVCQFCLRCNHTEDDCPHVNIDAADASRPTGGYTCPRCLQAGDHWASHCKSLSKDLLKQRFRGKSLQAVNSMRKQSGHARSHGNRKQSLVTFGKLVNNEVVKSFRKAGKLATKDPEIRSRVVAHLLATMDSDPVLEKPATVAAASMSSNVDMEYVRSLQREFAAHQFAADQNRLSPRRARK